MFLNFAEGDQSGFRGAIRKLCKNERKYMDGVNLEGKKRGTERGGKTAFDLYPVT